jgi:hypothetical protein
MCVYCRMSKKSRVGRSGLIFFLLLLLSVKPELVVPGSGIRFWYFIFEISGNPSFIIPPLPEGGGGYTVLPPSVQDIFRRIFLSNCWWQRSDIWSQVSYRYTILWEAFLDPSDSYFLFADLVGFYTLNIYAHFSSHFSQQLLMAEIWYLVTSFIYVPHIVGSIFGPIRFLLPVCRLCWFLYTLNIHFVYVHFSSYFSQQLLMAEIWYLVTSFI